MQDADTAGRGGEAARAGGGAVGAVSRWVPWSRQTLLFGAAVSVFLHLAFLLWATLFVWVDRPASASTGDGEVPLAVVAQGDLEDGLFSGLAVEVPTLERLEEPDLSVPSEQGPATDAAELTVTEVGEVGGAGDVQSIGGGSVFGSGGGAEFFGVEARGTRFAYVLDVSGSMEGPRIDALRGALGRSVGGLFEHAQFVVVSYNDRAFPLAGGEWLAATDRTKRRILGQFNTIDPSGGTNPLPAFEAVFALKPRPDAIYFMTDGVFEQYEQALLDLLLVENEGGGRVVPIHCITLIERGAAATMETIAQRSGGSYTHIAGSTGP